MRMPADFPSKVSGLERRMRRLLVLPVLVCMVAGCGPVAADASSSIDESLLQIEQVGPRLSSMPSAVDTAAKAVAEGGDASTSEAQSLLETAVRSSFDADRMGAEILKSVEEIDDETIDADAFANAAVAFEDGRAKVARIYEAQDRIAAKDIEARLASADSGPRIRELTELMAAPELAVETAFTTQLIYVAIEAFANSGTAELASEEKWKSETQNVIAALRSRNENEKPMPKDVARLDEKVRLSFILATIPPEHLTVLLDFYRSSGGKAKRRALVDSYTQVSGKANSRMLQEYFSALANYLKTHPRRNSSD